MHTFTHRWTMMRHGRESVSVLKSKEKLSWRSHRCLWGTKCGKQFENKTGTMKLALLSIHWTVSFDHFWIYYKYDFLQLCVSIWNVCPGWFCCCFRACCPTRIILTLSSLTAFFMHLVQNGARSNSCSAAVNHSQIRLHVHPSLHDTSFFRLFAFSPIRPLPAYLPLSSPLTSPLPFTSWTKPPLPFHCICLLAIIIRAVSHHCCSAAFSPTLLPNSPQSISPQSQYRLLVFPSLFWAALIVLIHSAWVKVKYI